MRCKVKKLLAEAASFCSINVVGNSRRLQKKSL